jgi:hypothetical protein
MMHAKATRDKEKKFFFINITILQRRSLNRMAIFMTFRKGKESVSASWKLTQFKKSEITGESA